MQFITTIPMLTTAVENGQWHCLIENRGFLAFTISFPAPIKSVLGDLARLLTLWLGSTLRRGKRVSFSPKSDKVTQPFFQDCRKKIRSPYSYSKRMEMLLTQKLQNSTGYFIIFFSLKFWLRRRLDWNSLDFCARIKSERKKRFCQNIWNSRVQLCLKTKFGIL